MTSSPDQQPEQREAPRPLRRRLNAAGAWPPGYQGRPGQRPPRRFTALTAIQAIWPGYVQQFKTIVPEEFWSVTDDTKTAAIVACPCGAEPQVEQNQTSICSGEECGRVFLYLGDEVKVAKFDSAELVIPAEEPVPAQASND